MNNFIIIIPARFNSSRFPGKVLADLCGKTLLEHVYNKAKLAEPQKIIIATDHEKILKTAKNFASHVYLTEGNFNSGTERIAYMANQLNLPADTVIVNLQADEPLINPQFIKLVANSLFDNSDASIATLANRIKLTDLKLLSDPNIVKLVCNSLGYAIYFSRSVIPYNRDQAKLIKFNYLRHIGLYAYRAKFLQTYSKLPECNLEKLEKLEQLRAIYYGYKIFVTEINCPNSLFYDVNTEADLAKIKGLINSLA